MRVRVRLLRRDRLRFGLAQSNVEGPFRSTAVYETRAIRSGRSQCEGRFHAAACRTRPMSTLWRPRRSLPRSAPRRALVRVLWAGRSTTGRPSAAMKPRSWVGKRRNQDDDASAGRQPCPTRDREQQHAPLGSTTALQRRDPRGAVPSESGPDRTVASQLERIPAHWDSQRARWPGRHERHVDALERDPGRPPRRDLDDRQQHHRRHRH